jgi:hypothetical protein
MLRMRTVKVLLGVLAVPLLLANSCQFSQDDLVGAKTSGDSTAPDVTFDTVWVATPSGVSLGKWSATPTSSNPPIANLQNNVDVIVAAQATDNDGGAKSVRIYSFLEKTECISGDITTVTQGLQSDKPAAETSDNSARQPGEQVLKRRGVVYTLHTGVPINGTADHYCKSYYRVYGEGQNYSGQVVKTRSIEFTFDTRRVLG